MHIFGYLDSGSGSMIASALAAGFGGVVVFFKMIGRKVANAVSPKRRRSAAEAAKTAGA
ncbi:MAG TPA: hypothetical protein VGO03_11525 [Acidimicrobiia bacterium]|jgi:hypothetical protein